MDDTALLADLFGHVPVPAGARDDLIARMAGPGRYYHDLGHLAQLWGHHLRFGAGLAVGRAPWHRLIACAIAFHDAVYDPARRDNEARSAALWHDVASAVAPWEADWVAGTILATADHAAAAPAPGMPPEAWTARLWMLDLDLTPLAAPPAQFDANTVKLRREYSHLDDAAWTAGRLGFLRHCAAHPVLFRSAPLNAAFEAAARANLARALLAGC
jgi:predicted metal-dependent HD superfamily phosphohydrolase